jgi:hypothetical protein
MRFACVCAQDGRSARVGEDRHPVTRRQWLVAQHPGGVEQLFERIGADDARLLKQRILAQA